MHARSTDCGPEDQRDRRIAGQLNGYYDKVISLIVGAGSILILGPGQAKLEFKKRLESKALPGCEIALESCDEITNSQIAAKISRHFTG